MSGTDKCTTNPNIAFTKEQRYEAITGDDHSETSYISSAPTRGRIAKCRNLPIEKIDRLFFTYITQIFII